MARPSQEPLHRLRLVPIEPGTAPSFPLDHEYVEIVYQPLVGPTAVSLARRFAWLIATNEPPVAVDAGALAAEVGLRSASSAPLGSRSPLLRAIDRLEHIDIVRWLNADDLGVLRAVPPVGQAALDRLPESVRSAHLRLLDT